MKHLFIGGTGNISAACVRYALSLGHEVVLLNRGNREGVEGTDSVVADIDDADAVKRALGDRSFDSISNFIAFTPDAVERDLELFAERCRQYVFVSSASAYQKPPRRPVVTESTPLHNPFWQYSRNKIACEDRLMQAYREQCFPVTIVRPSHTYDTILPLPLVGDAKTMLQRIRDGRPIVVHGDGTSLWTITHCDDFAVAYVGLLGNPAAIGEAIHITSDEALTWNQIVDAIGHACGVSDVEKVHVPSDLIAKLYPHHEGTLLGDKAHSVLFDNTKVKRLVPTFQTNVPFHVGIRRTIAWFDAQPEPDAEEAATTNAMQDRLIEMMRSLF